MLFVVVYFAPRRRPSPPANVLRARMGSGCASVLSTHSSSGSVSLSLNGGYRFLSVSASQKLCCVFVAPASAPTVLQPRVAARHARVPLERLKDRPPCSRYAGSPVARYSRNSDSTVSGRCRLRSGPAP
jgi:hypothetical protein